MQKPDTTDTSSDAARDRQPDDTQTDAEPQRKPAGGGRGGNGPGGGGGARRRAGEVGSLKPGADGLPRGMGGGGARRRRRLAAAEAQAEAGADQTADAETSETDATSDVTTSDASITAPDDVPEGAADERTTESPKSADASPDVSLRKTAEPSDPAEAGAGTAAEPKPDDEDDSDDDEGDDGPALPGGRRGRRGRRGGRGAEPKVIYVPPPTVSRARGRARHWGVVASFICVVLFPVYVGGYYLYERAENQFASTMGFSVRREEGATPTDLIGGVLSFGQQSSSDTDVLYRFIQSQDMVAKVDARLDLRTIYTKPEDDPIFALPDDATIEDLVSYWQRMVTIYYDGGTGLMEVRVLAFDPQDAQNISKAIFDESSRMINELSAIARDDTTAYAREELEMALERLKGARTALTEFRARTQIVDPQADIQIQLGVLSTLNAELAQAQIELDILRESAREGDPRLRQQEQRIEVIENRIAEERKKFGIGEPGTGGTGAFATLVSEYESLIVDREYAESAYLAALSNLNSALAEAQRQSRYLAAHVPPTLAESAEYPQREVQLGVIALILFMIWAIGTMLFYSIKDRR